jgi:3-oxoacyl-[acyl-carrier protein] reductase
MSRFEGKTVLVVGGAQGMGRACAERFGAEGANLVLFDIEEDTLKAAASELSAKGYPVEAVAGDVSVREPVHKAVTKAVDRFGRLDVLVHTAAIVVLTPLLDFPEETWRRIIDVNLTGVFLTTQEAGRAMAKTGGGAIVVFASTNAFYVEELNVPYSATKGGIVTFVRNAALDLARHKIRINAVDPGIINTRLSASLIEDPVAGPEYLKRIPLGRWGSPDDIAKVVVFLASDDAGYITGEDVIIDGGVTLGVSLGIEDLKI